MNGLHMTAIDLNLLRVFDTLLTERSVTRAGTRLGLSQSAVSHALNRLRYALDDELFVRGPSGMTPTARAQELGPQVHAALSQLQAAFAPRDFDPATTERRFTVVAGSYACAVLIPPLVSRLAEEAPSVELVVADAAVDVLEQLDARRTDFVVGAVVAGPPRISVSPLLTDSLVWTVRAQSPLSSAPIGLEELLSLQHVVIAKQPQLTDMERANTGLLMHASWEDLGAFDAALKDAGRTRRVGVVVPDTYSALGIVARSDMAALIPRRLAMLSAQRGFIQLVEPPYPAAPIELSLLTLRDRLADPAIAWMHDLLCEVGREV